MAVLKRIIVIGGSSLLYGRHCNFYVLVQFTINCKQLYGATCSWITMLLFHCRYYSMFLFFEYLALIHLCENGFDAQGKRLVGFYPCVHCTRAFKIYCSAELITIDNKCHLSWNLRCCLFLFFTGCWLLLWFKWF